MQVSLPQEAQAHTWVNLPFYDSEKPMILGMSVFPSEWLSFPYPYA